MMHDNDRAFHLLFERLAGVDCDGQSISSSSARSLEKLEILDGVNFLRVSTTKRKPPTLKHKIRGEARDHILLQPIRYESVLKLLMLNPGSIPINVNGAPAPPVTLLDEKDEVMFDPVSGYMAHVTLYHTPEIGPPRENELGMKCPICRSRFTRETVVYRCHNCSRPLHNEENIDIPPEIRLECAKICTVCPACHAEIRMNTGYRYLPEFCKTTELGREVSSECEDQRDQS